MEDRKETDAETTSRLGQRRVVSVRNVTGAAKLLFNLHVHVRVFFHFLPMLFEGRLSPLGLVQVLRRLIHFFDLMQVNKFVEIGGKIRCNLYVPGFPSPAFFTACDKFNKFGQKLPCATVLMSITSGCRYRCVHCYQRMDKGKDIDIEHLVKAAHALQDHGVAFFNVEGGDPFIRYDRLKRLCEAIDPRSEIWVNSTGDGITPERIAEMRACGVTAIMFSLHKDAPRKFNEFTGTDTAWTTLIEGIGICHDQGMPVALNCCVEREGFHDGSFQRIMELAKQWGVCMVQLIHPKAAGAWLENRPGAFSPEDLDRVKSLVHQYNQDPDHRDFPSISAQILEEDAETFGCPSGGTDRFYINAKGDVQPCEFLNLSFGNIAEEEFEVIYDRMRAVFERPGQAWLCEKYSADIQRLYAQHQLKSLPLPPELSRQIYENWDRGPKTELYERLDGMK